MPPALSQTATAFTARDIPENEAANCYDDRLRKLSDVELLAYFIWSETRGEQVEGKLAVGHVVLNRVEARSHFGSTIREVVLRSGHFRSFKGNDSDSALSTELPSGDIEFALCKAIAELATRGHLKNDPTGGATHFHRLNAKPPWASALTYLRQIGNHVFYRESITRSREDQGLKVQKRGNGREL